MDARRRISPVPRALGCGALRKPRLLDGGKLGWPVVQNLAPWRGLAWRVSVSPCWRGWKKIGNTPDCGLPYRVASVATRGFKSLALSSTLGVVEMSGSAEDPRRK